MSNEQNSDVISTSLPSTDGISAWITPSLIEETVQTWRNLGRDLSAHEAEAVLMSFAQLHDLIQSPRAEEEPQ